MEKNCKNTHRPTAQTTGQSLWPQTVSTGRLGIVKTATTIFSYKIAVLKCWEPDYMVYDGSKGGIIPYDDSRVKDTRHFIRNWQSYLPNEAVGGCVWGGAAIWAFETALPLCTLPLKAGTWERKRERERNERKLKIMDTFLYACPLTQTQTVDSTSCPCVQIWLSIITYVLQCSLGISNLIGLNTSQWPGCPWQGLLCGIHRRQTPLPSRPEGGYNGFGGTKRPW